MSFVTTQPEALSAAAGNLQGIGADLTAHNAAAASPTTAVMPGGSRRGVGADRGTVHRARPAVSSGQCSSRGDSRNVRVDPEHQCRVLRGHRSRQRGRCGIRGAVAMDFGALPPEINSARMYAGPGSGPMLAAASAWDVLAAELGSAASTYSSVVSSLAEAILAGTGVGIDGGRGRAVRGHG